MKHVTGISLFWLAFGFCFLLVIPTYAQIPLGIKGGVVVNEITFRKPIPENSRPWQYESLVSAHLGFFSKVKISDAFTFIPELQFIQKQSILKAFGSRNIKLGYIEAPLIISYTPIQWLGIDAGGSAAVNIEDSSLGNQYSSFDAGLIGGLRFNVTDEFSVLGRFYYGVTPINTIGFSRVGVPRVEYDAYNQNLQFALSYYLD